MNLDIASKEVSSIDPTGGGSAGVLLARLPVGSGACVPSPEVPRSFKLSHWLRGLGAASFVGAGASFLVEGWTDPGVLKRQLLWALGTLIMTIGGIVSIRRYRDALGARLFLGLAAATIPAHFAQVGASLWALNSEHTGTPGAVLAAGAILLALGPALALGVSALVRRRSRLLVTLMFVTGAPLIIPTRHGDVIALIGVFELSLCLAVEALVFRRDALFRTVEGISARILLFLPAAIALGRNAFYEPTRLWLSAVVFVPSCALLVLPRVWSRTGPLSLAGQILGILGVALAAVLALPHVPSLCLVLSVVALVGSEISAGRPVVFAWCAAVFLAMVGVVSLFAPNPWLIVAAVPVGTIHALSAFRRRSVELTVITILVTLSSLVAHLVQLVHIPTHHVWVPAVALSVLLLAAGSLVEQRRDRIQHGVSRLQRHFRGKL